MPNPQQFLLPDVGEGLTEADILHWAVRPGDSVEINQVVVEIETAKSAVELPSPYAGVVTALHAEEGESLPVGHPLITIDVASAEAPPIASGPATTDVTPITDGPADRSDGPQQALLVGYGPRADRSRHSTRSAAQAAEPAEQAPAPSAARPLGAAGPARVAAKPPVRKLAKTLNVDLRSVRPTGPGGTVTRADVHQAAAGPEPAAPAAGAHPAPEEPQTTRIPVRGVRKHTAAAMVASAFTAPHVTEFITVDITATMQLRDTVAGRREFRDLRVTPVLFAARALLLALGNTPEANAAWDEQAQEIVLKHYVNLGIAVATQRGLVVPNVKNAQRMSLRELAEGVGRLTSTARAGGTTPQDMAGGTITITNVGVFGVDSGTPILNPGEAAILALGAVRRAPWIVGRGAEERIEPRWVTQLALSFDHRVIDGQQGSQLLADTAAILRDPGLALL